MSEQPTARSRPHARAQHWGICDEERLRFTWLDERRLGGALERRPPPHVPDRARPRRPGGLGPGRGPAVRLQQHPLRHEHPHRRVGARQDDPLRAPDPRRRPAHLGLRVGGQAPPAQLPVAAPGEHPRRDDRPARRGRARTPACSARPPARSRRSCEAEGVADMPLGVDIVEPPMLAALADGGHHRPRRPAGDARRARGQVDRRDHPAQHGLRDGRRRLPAHRRAAQAGRPRERARRERHQVPVRPGLRARRQHQRRLGRALQPASARLQRPAHPARRPGLLRHHPDLRRLQDLLLPDVRRSARPTTPSATPTSRRASGSTRPSS